MAGAARKLSRSSIFLSLAFESAYRRIVESMNLIKIIDELRRELTDIDHAIHSLERVSSFAGRKGAEPQRFGGIGNLGGSYGQNDSRLPGGRSKAGICRNCEMSGPISKALRKSHRKQRP